MSTPQFSRKTHTPASNVLLSAVLLPCFLGFQLAVGAEIILHQSQDYQDFKVGEVIGSADGGYQMVVEPDPENKKNLVARIEFGNGQPVGLPGYMLEASKTQSGAFVVEQKVRFAGKAEEIFGFSTQIRGAKPDGGAGAGIPLWDITNKQFFGTVPQPDEWYMIRCLIDHDKSSLNTFVTDSGGRFVYQRADFPLLSQVDVSRGFVNTDPRFQGTSGSGAILIDDFRLYKVDAAAFVADIANEEALAKSRRHKYSDQPYGVKKPEIEVAETARLTEGVEARRQAFESRNSPESLGALAKELASMTRNEHEALKTFHALVEKGSHREALIEFRSHFFNTIRGMDELYFDSTFEYPELRETSRTKMTHPKGDIFLFDTIPLANRVVDLGSPGVVNWEYEAPVKKFDYSYFFLKPPLWDYATFDPLFWNYLGTGNEAYLTKWSEYMDDWSMNERGFTNLLPPEVPDPLNGSRVARNFVFRLRALAKNSPQGGAEVPEATLARLVVKIFTDYPVQSIIYTRSNPQNWTYEQHIDQMCIGFIFQDLGWRTGDELVRAGLRRFEVESAIQHLPDGSDIEQVVGYNIVHMKGLYNVLRVVRGLRPELGSPEWFDEQIAAGKLRATFLLHMLTPQGGFPLAVNSDLRDRTYMLEEIEEWLPEALDESENRAVVAAIRSRGKSEPPSFNSEGFSYGGYYHIREKWTPEGHQGYLFGTSHPTISNMASNVFTLTAFDQQMIVPGSVGMYDGVKHFLRVDGKQQHNHAGVPQWGHRNVMGTAWDEPENNRWHNSNRFDLAEVSYNGHYGNEGDTISDVAHRRTTHFLREHGLWIVTDYLTSEEEHQYTTRWTLPRETVAPRHRERVKAYHPDRIEINETESFLKTQDPGMPNLSIYNFSTSPLTYTTDKKEIQDDNSSKVSDFFYLDVAHTGKGDHVLVSAMYPRAGQGDELAAMKRIDTDNKAVTGFEATTADGTVIRYLVSADKKQILKIGGLSVNGESLLMVRKPTGEISGIALGSTALQYEGKMQTSVDSPNFELEITKEGLSVVRSIHTPIGSVKVLPEASVFSGQTHVEMDASEQDVEIRYTLDQSEPDLTSPVYEEPVLISQSTVVKARAFRKGTTTVPISRDGTHASATTTAVFNRMPEKEPADVTNLEPGLRYNYFKGDWKREFLDLDSCTPKKSGLASGVFDFSARDTSGPFAFEYTGYIDIPKDGVYKFHAPKEYVRQNVMEGYELNVYIGKTRWYPATRRHSLGTWSVSLKAGKHPFRLTYADFRADTPAEYNTPGLADRIWAGTVPQLNISGPDLPERAIPNEMLFRQK